MKKIFFAIMFLFSFLLLGKVAHASIVITEVMYDVSSEIGADADREWVEIYNNGEEDVDLTGWKFNDGSKPNHNLNIPPAGGGQGSIVIPPQSYAILSGNAGTFISLYPSFSGTVIDTVMSLNNESETVKIIDTGGATISEFSYTSALGASGDGNTLQKLSNGQFLAQAPTLGTATVENTSTGGSGGSDSGSGAGTTTSSNKNTPIPKKEEPRTITTEIISKAILPISIDSKFEAKTLGVSREPLRYGKWLWNMGDGMAFEKTAPDVFTYKYEYPGEYLVTLEYYDNYYSYTPIATDQILIKAFATDVSISILENSAEKFIALKNNTAYEINIAGFSLRGIDGKVFTMPAGTKIFPNKTLIISPKVSGFSDSVLFRIDFLYPSGEILTTFPEVENPPVKVPRKTNAIQTNNPDFQFLPTGNEQIKSSEESISLENEIDPKSLSAEVGGAISNSKTVIILGFIGLLILSSVALLRIRIFSRKNTKTEGEVSADDFKLIDE